MTSYRSACRTVFAAAFTFAICLMLSQEICWGQNASEQKLWTKSNLVAWCIVPFDSQKRTPEQRAEMLERIGITKLAYDYRAEHIPTFDAEMAALKRHGIELTAWWFPGDLNDEAKLILDVLKRHQIKAQLWVTGGGDPTTSTAEQRNRVEAEAARIGRIAKAADEIGCSVGLYNHGGWFGEPENQIEIIKHLKLPNVGIVYNQHHGHHQVDRFAKILDDIKPYLLTLNLNGMTADGDRKGQKILPIGAGELDVRLMRVIEESGYEGPIGILNHTDEDAELRLRDNLDGLEYVLDQLHGTNTVEKPTYRSWKGEIPEYATYDWSPRIEMIVIKAKDAGDAMRGMQVFASSKFACLSCHKVGKHGGDVGPAMDSIAPKRSVEHLVDSVLWPQKNVEPEYQSSQILLASGKVVTGYVIEENDQMISLKDTSNGTIEHIQQDDIEFQRVVGSVMPVGLTDAMRSSQLADLVAFLADLGKWEQLDPQVLDSVLGHWTTSEPAKFDYALAPLRPETFGQLDRPVNRNRLFDYYAKQARHFAAMDVPPPLLAEFPGLDGPGFGHWGNQNESGWADPRWNETDLGSLQCGVFRGAGIEVPRGVCVRLGENNELSACFNSQTLTYDAIWKGNFVKFSSVRHGFMDGLIMDGELVGAASQEKQTKKGDYLGYYCLGRRVVFAYKIDGVEYWDAPWVENGEFVRDVRPRDQHPLNQQLQSSEPQWPQEIPTSIELGQQSPYSVDRIGLPTENPWSALVYCGGHDFLPNGDAIISTMQGDVWKVTGLDAANAEKGEKPIWRRIAAGLQQALGVVAGEDGVYVLGRNQITRLHDLNGDGETDFYEAFCTGYQTSPAGHDFICGLQRDGDGYFYTASGNQGLLKISPDGKRVEVIATGFRNPDGLGVRPDGSVTVPCSEGNWTPASLICEIEPDDQLPHFGYPGPRDGQVPALPLAYLPRGVDNSSGGQVYIDSERWGPFAGSMVHTSFGAGTHMVLLRDEVNGVAQGAIIPLAGDHASGVHRARFSPKDGQLYVSGMAGWGTYTTDDGCIDRVRYTGQRVQQPVGFHVHENGVLVEFAEEVSPQAVQDIRKHFAQVWNYRYSGSYGSPEYSTLHIGVRGHDVLAIRSAHVVNAGRSVFFELPDLQPVNQLHLMMNIGEQHPCDMFITVHTLDRPFADFPNYKPEAKLVRAHPIFTDMSLATNSVPNPYKQKLEGARKIKIRTATNLAYETREFTVKAGEPIEFTLANPDVVPHNWALLKPGTEQQVGEMANRMIADPEAMARQYVPDTENVLAYTDVVEPKQDFTIYFQSPSQPGRYPFMCTFPGHWMVMRGWMVVE